MHNASSPSMRGRRIAAIASAAALICSFGAVGATPAFADTYSSDLVATAEGAVTRGTIPAGALSVVNYSSSRWILGWFGHLRTGKITLPT